MDFYELLDDVLKLLHQRGRVTYRALKRQFHLDDEVLDDLREEILYGQRLAVEEDGRVLVWMGGTSIPPESISSPSPFREEPQVEQETRVAPRPTAAPTPEAERRQLTVLFCDWWTRPCSPANSTPKSGARWCGPIKTPAPR
jgi:hypothetical protein